MVRLPESHVVSEAGERWRWRGGDAAVTYTEVEWRGEVVLDRNGPLALAFGSIALYALVFLLVGSRPLPPSSLSRLDPAPRGVPPTPPPAGELSPVPSPAAMATAKFVHNVAALGVLGACCCYAVWYLVSRGEHASWDKFMCDPLGGDGASSSLRAVLEVWEWGTRSCWCGPSGPRRPRTTARGAGTRRRCCTLPPRHDLLPLPARVVSAACARAGRAACSDPTPPPARRASSSPWPPRRGSCSAAGALGDVRGARRSPAPGHHSVPPTHRPLPPPAVRVLRRPGKFSKSTSADHAGPDFAARHRDGAVIITPWQCSDLATVSSTHLAGYLTHSSLCPCTSSCSWSSTRNASTRAAPAGRRADQVGRRAEEATEPATPPPSAAIIYTRRRVGRYGNTNGRE